MARLLILGARGQLGTELVEASSSFDMGAETLNRADLDLTRRAAIRPTLDAREFDVLINCAAFTAVDAAEGDAGTAFAVNAHAVEELASVCAERGALLVQPGTDYVFDGTADRPYRVDDPPGPLNVYGASKLVGEALARGAHPDETLVIRTSSVFGLEAARGGGGNFVETILRVAAGKGHVRVVDDVVMAPTHAADLARAILALIEGGARSGTFHYTNAGQASWYELAEAVVRESGIDAEVEPVPSSEYPTVARRPAYSVLDTSGTIERIGEAPHWREALGRYLAAREAEGLGPRSEGKGGAP